MDSLHDVHELVKLEDYEEVKMAAQTLAGVPVVEGNVKQSDEVSDNDYLSKLQS
jgi:hypothetical protein